MQLVGKREKRKRELSSLWWSLMSWVMAVLHEQVGTAVPGVAFLSAGGANVSVLICWAFSGTRFLGLILSAHSFVFLPSGNWVPKRFKTFTLWLVFSNYTCQEPGSSSLVQPEHCFVLSSCQVGTEFPGITHSPTRPVLHPLLGFPCLSGNWVPRVNFLSARTIQLSLLWSAGFPKNWLPGFILSEHWVMLSCQVGTQVPKPVFTDQPTHSRYLATFIQPEYSAVFLPSGNWVPKNFKTTSCSSGNSSSPPTSSDLPNKKNTAFWQCLYPSTQLGTQFLRPLHQQNNVAV